MTHKGCQCETCEKQRLATLRRYFAREMERHWVTPRSRKYIWNKQERRAA